MAIKIYRKKDQNIQKLKQENEKLKEELDKLRNAFINLKVQYQNLYEDFQSYKNMISKREKQEKVNTLINIIKNIIPLIENIRLSVENIPDDIKNHQWVKGIELTYKNLLKTLENINIYQIDSVGKTPNEQYHEPIGTQKTEDNEKKGKIVKEHQKCYVYKDSGTEIVICPAKVIVGI